MQSTLLLSLFTVTLLAFLLSSANASTSKSPLSHPKNKTHTRPPPKAVTAKSLHTRSATPRKTRSLPVKSGAHATLSPSPKKVARQAVTKSTTAKRKKPTAPSKVSPQQRQKRLSTWNWV